MKLLALETATEACSVALLYQQEILEQFEIAPRQHSELLLPMVDRLLAEAGLRLCDLDAIALGYGPGSFMGVRLAVASAQGLAMGANLPVVPVSTLQAMAQRAWQHWQAPHVAPAWDARMGEMYWGGYQEQGGIMLPLIDDHLSAPPVVSLPLDINWRLVGNAWMSYRENLPSQWQQEADLLHPSAAAVASLAQHYYLLGQMLPPDQVEPKYLRQRVAFRPGER